MSRRNRSDTLRPDQIRFYFRKERIPLMIVAVSGLIYNIGLTAGPYFEGRLAQKLYDIIEKRATISEMVRLALFYFLVILLVQGARCLKRFFVRRFANNTSRSMRQTLYHHLVHQSKMELEQESAGTMMTKAVADVDACVEGMRKFTTELFDTGIALAAYLGMMFFYDWKLTVISCIFTPIAYVIAEKMKVVVYRCNAAYKKSAGVLNDKTMERVHAALLYRVTGQEENRNADYENQLKDYEKKAILANLWENTLQPIYNIISMTGVIFILYFGGKNVLGTGFRSWDIGVFTAFLSCFVKMALKSSKAAKLFNAVQKAQVSWKRIKPLLAAKEVKKEKETAQSTVQSKKNTDEVLSLKVTDLSVRYKEQEPVFSGLKFDAMKGDIIGVTGPVACGKTSFGRVFLCEIPYEGSILLNGKELYTYADSERNQLISYLGHQPELMSDSIEANICYGEKREITSYLKAVCLENEIAQMDEGIKTEIGSQGVRLSGGQQKRLALARTLYHGRKVFILDDPFSAVDGATANQIMEQIKNMAPTAIFIILSHRITMFPEFTKIIWIQDGRVETGTHEELLKKEKLYKKIFTTQMAGGDLDEA
ncbi:MAG: ABC transporter ATP-binding protein [Lachnospiraceae bacterium]|nr:ABC transporter ATP-binding protein [Lachnospiraceae bacterium]